MSAANASVGTAGIVQGSSSLEAKLATLRIRWSVTERVRLYERLRRFLEHQVSVDDALAAMIMRTNRPRGMFKSRDPMRFVYQRWFVALRRGKKFTDPEVAGRDLPPGEVIMLMMGDSTSSPAEGFEQARFVADVVRRMKSALMLALIYPAVLMLMGCGFLAGIAYKFGPQMKSMTDKPVDLWPAMSKMLYTLAEATKSYGLLVGGVAIVIAVVSVWSLPRWTKLGLSVRRFCDHYVPPWSIYREYNASSCLIALGSMVQAAVPVDEAIARIISISTPWMQTHLRLVLSRIRRGDDAGMSFDTGLLADDTLGYLEDFNRAGGLDSALAVVGKETVEEAITRVRSGAVVLGGLGMVLVVLLIVLIYGGMMSLGMMVYKDSQAG